MINGKFLAPCRYSSCSRPNCNYQHNEAQEKARKSFRYVQYDLKLALSQGKENKRKYGEMVVDSARKDGVMKRLKTYIVGWQKKCAKKEDAAEAAAELSALQKASIQTSLATTQASLLEGNRTNESVSKELTSVVKKHDDLLVLLEAKRMEYGTNVERSYRRGYDNARRSNQRSQEERRTQSTYLRQTQALLRQEEGANADLRREIADLKDLFYGTQRPKTPENC
jgi:hypothetical protein